MNTEREMLLGDFPALPRIDTTELDRSVETANRIADELRDMAATEEVQATAREPRDALEVTR